MGVRNVRDMDAIWVQQALFCSNAVITLAVALVPGRQHPAVESSTEV